MNRYQPWERQVNPTYQPGIFMPNSNLVEKKYNKLKTYLLVAGILGTLALSQYMSNTYESEDRVDQTEQVEVRE